jgi:glutamate/tyrosine decarboxylase-like PLP-dependent enzyme
MDTINFIASSHGRTLAAVKKFSVDALPPPDTIIKATATLPTSLPASGRGENATQNHLISDLCPAFNGQKTTSNYYGFVTGGMLPVAEVADNIVTAFDQNVGVHLPDQSISSIIEDRALSMLAELVNIGNEFQGRTFTTGATASNILGLACGREAIVKRRLEAAGESGSVGELGLLAACSKAGIKEIRVLTSMGHSSLFKAASVVGIGRASVKDIACGRDEPWKFDLDALEEELKSTKNGVAHIVTLSAGEVNSGRFATDGLSTNRKIRELCDKYGAWFHVDAAFGLFARSLPPIPEFQALILASSGLELADSIGGDCHKMLNVPYDCGVFWTRTSDTLFSAFQNANAAYLATGPSSIPSPLNIGIENSRRFRALPVYAVLVAYGRSGFAEIFAKQVRLARAISNYIDHHPALELLAQGSPPSHPTSHFHHLSLSSPQPTGTNTPIERPPYEHTHIIVIFKAKDDRVNDGLADAMCRTRRIHVSGSSWQGKKAVRIAVSTWKVEVEQDLAVVKGVLEEILTGSS